MNTHFDAIGHRKIDERNLRFNDFIGHYVHVPPDDDQPVTFKFHFPKGTLSPRMSGYELCEFILPHMGAILSKGLFSDHPRVEHEFNSMFQHLLMAGRPNRKNGIQREELLQICFMAIKQAEVDLKDAKILAIDFMDSLIVQNTKDRLRSWKDLEARAIENQKLTVHDWYLIVRWDIRHDANLVQRKAILDRLLPWLKPIIGEEEDDTIFLSLFANEQQKTGPAYFT